MHEDGYVRVSISGCESDGVRRCAHVSNRVCLRVRGGERVFVSMCMRVICMSVCVCIYECEGL